MAPSGNIFMTGGTGTLGCSIIWLAEQNNWDASITVYSRDEFKQAQLRARFPWVRTVIGDVRDFERVELAMAGHDIVFHLAAMKRIPECEANPGECWLTNVVGSSNVLMAAIHNRVNSIVGISTDKACRAITAYGASKRLMESIYRAATNSIHSTLVRYGNVVSSRGSVIPIWKKQFAEAGKIEITALDMTRFFMSPLEAAQLAIEALDIAPGLVLVPKMESIRIIDMAHWALEGFEDKHAVEVGRRSLEKLHEDLISPDEPVDEDEDVFLMGESETAELGRSWTSDQAPHLAKSHFEQMTADALAVDGLLS